MRFESSRQRSRCFWTPAWRVGAFALAASSIWSLLAEFYGLCSMRTFTLFVSMPALGVLLGFAVTDRFGGSGELWRAVWVGGVAGLLAAVAYDVFRLPFVFARPLGIAGLVPPLNLYKVFPGIGAMILGQPVEQASYSVAAQSIGWAYHFSNDLTFGIMYVAAIGPGSRRHWAWGMVMAAGLELAMLLTPYPRVFGIAVTPSFVAATLTAHLIFGAVMGLTVRWVASGRAGRNNLAEMGL